MFNHTHTLLHYEPITKRPASRAPYGGPAERAKALPMQAQMKPRRPPETQMAAELQGGGNSEKNAKTVSSPD